MPKKNPTYSEHVSNPPKGKKIKKDKEVKEVKEVKKTILKSITDSRDHKIKGQFDLNGATITFKSWTQVFDFIKERLKKSDNLVYSTKTSHQHLFNHCQEDIYLIKYLLDRKQPLQLNPKLSIKSLWNKIKSDEEKEELYQVCLIKGKLSSDMAYLLHKLREDVIPIHTKTKEEMIEILKDIDNRTGNHKYRSVVMKDKFSVERDEHYIRIQETVSIKNAIEKLK